MVIIFSILEGAGVIIDELHCEERKKGLCLSGRSVSCIGYKEGSRRRSDLSSYSTFCFRSPSPFQNKHFATTKHNCVSKLEKLELQERKKLQPRPELSPIIWTVKVNGCGSLGALTDVYKLCKS